MPNFNTKICVQKPKLIFWNKYLTNFFFASVSFTYKGIINNFNIYNVLTFEKTVFVLCIKKTELTNLRAIKENSIHFAA